MTPTVHTLPPFTDHFSVTPAESYGATSYITRQIRVCGGSAPWDCGGDQNSGQFQGEDNRPTRKKDQRLRDELWFELREVQQKRVVSCERNERLQGFFNKYIKINVYIYL